MAADAQGFQSFITKVRAQKRAEQIFSSGRRQSAPASQPRPGSLASRVGSGIRKRPSFGPRRASSFRDARPQANSDWTHDLYQDDDDDDDNDDNSNNNIGETDARTRLIKRGNPHARNERRANLSRGLQRAERDTAVAQQLEVVAVPPRGPRAQQQHSRRGISIRGVAGPYSVIAQNFAPGTSAADIQSAMKTAKGDMSDCIVLRTSPIMTVEMVFETKDAADAVIDGFNDKTADGRLIKVYHKPGGYASDVSFSNQRPISTRDHDSDVIDGTLGFPDHDDGQNRTDRDRGRRDHRNGGLYSDRLVERRRQDRAYGGGSNDISRNGGRHSGN